MPMLLVDIHIRKRYLFFIFIPLTLNVLSLIYPYINKFLKRSPPRPSSLHTTELARNLFTNLHLASITDITMLQTDKATLQRDFSRSGSFGGVTKSNLELDGYDLEIRGN